MRYLCLDTAYKYLSLSIIEDNKIIAAYDELCFKHQSEEIFVRLQELFESVNLKPLDIDAICITKGPGSYTGVRIAMTLAKTICDITDIKLYTISTLKLYANNQEDTLVLLDARSNRCYYGLFDKGEAKVEDTIYELDKVDLGNHNLVGDLSLFGKDDHYFKISECFLNNINNFEEVENISFLVPEYLKENEEYLKWSEEWKLKILIG